jgi:hypothetical protein
MDRTFDEGRWRTHPLETNQTLQQSTQAARRIGQSL